MKLPLHSLALLFFLLSLLGLAPLTLRAESVVDQIVSRKNYSDFLQSTAEQETSCELYDANIIDQGIIQTTDDHGNCFYAVADDIDPEAAIYGLTQLQQETYCTWLQDQNQNEGITSPLMMFGEFDQSKNWEKQERTDQQDRSTINDRSTLQTAPQSQTLKTLELKIISAENEANFRNEALTSLRYKKAACAVAVQTSERFFDAINTLYAFLKKTNPAQYRIFTKKFPSFLADFYKMNKSIRRQTKSKLKDLRALNKTALNKFSYAHTRIRALKRQQQAIYSAVAASEQISLAKTTNSKLSAEEREAALIEKREKEATWHGVISGRKTIPLSPAFLKELAELEHEQAEREAMERAEKESHALLTTTPPAAETKIPIADTSTDELHSSEQQDQESAESSSDEGEDVATANISSKKKRKKKKPKKKKTASQETVEATPATTQTESKTDAEWEAEMKKKYPFDSFNLADHKLEIGEFNDTAALVAKNLLDDPTQAALFEDIDELAILRMRNRDRLEYRISGNEGSALHRLKKTIAEKVNQDCYPGFIQEAIREAKHKEAERVKTEAELKAKQAKAEAELLKLLDEEEKSSKANKGKSKKN